VVQALHEAGLQADFVSGVSAGAMVGACYAAGLTVPELTALGARIGWLDIARPVALNPFRQGLGRLGLVDFHNLEMTLIRLIGDVTFDQLEKPFAVGASDLLTGEPVVITSGRVAQAVRASSSVPGLVVPTRWRDRILCDGFISNNVPIQVLRDMGADVVLAVNIMPRSQRLPSNFFWAGSNALSALVLRAGDPLDLADVAVEPDISEFSYLRPKAEAVMERGRKALAPVLSQLQDLLR
jgi:NTE family protein